VVSTLSYSTTVLYFGTYSKRLTYSISTTLLSTGMYSNLLPTIYAAPLTGAVAPTNYDAANAGTFAAGKSAGSVVVTGVVETAVVEWTGPINPPVAGRLATTGAYGYIGFPKTAFAGIT
jgi:hypothetical protein